jgi:hypothetical protein
MAKKALKKGKKLSATKTLSVSQSPILITKPIDKGS